MQIEEIGTLLATIALSDNRKISDAHIVYWDKVLPEWLALDDALAAVLQHRQTSTEYLTESHIITFAADARKKRAAARYDAAILHHVGEPYPPALAGDPIRERAWRTVWADLVRDGHPDPVTAADDAFRLPKRPALLAANVPKVRQLTSASRGVRP